MPIAGSDDGFASGAQPRVPTIYRTLLLLLYGSGMRIGEALRLTMQGRRSYCTGHHCSRHQVLQDTPRSDWAKAYPGTGCTYGASSPAPDAGGKHPRCSPRATVAAGAIRVLYHGFSMFVEPPESVAPSANLDLHACTTFATQRRCIGCSHGIAPARTSSDCSRNSPPTLATSISDRPNATYK